MNSTLTSCYIGQLLPYIDLEKQLLFMYNFVQDSLQQFLSSEIVSIEPICLEIFAHLATSMIVCPASIWPMIHHFTHSSNWYLRVMTNHFESLYTEIESCIAEIHSGIHFTHSAWFTDRWHNILIRISETVLSL